MLSNRKNQKLRKTVFTEKGLNLANYKTGVINNFQTANTSYDELIIRLVQDKKLGKIISDGNLFFAIYPIKSNDKEVTRFKLIKNYKHENLNKMQLSPDNWKNIFAEKFYEVDFNIFNNFIQQSLAYYVDMEKTLTAYDSHYQWGFYAIKWAITLAHWKPLTKLSPKIPRQMTS